HGIGLLGVDAAAAQVGGVDQVVPGRGQLQHEGVGGAAQLALVGPGRGREIGGLRQADDVSGAGGVHGDAVGLVQAGAPQGAGVDEAAAVGRQLGDEDVTATGSAAGNHADGRGEVGGVRVAHNVRRAGGIDRNGVALVGATAAQEGAVRQAGVDGEVFARVV